MDVCVGVGACGGVGGGAACVAPVFAIFYLKSYYSHMHPQCS